MANKLDAPKFIEEGNGLLKKAEETLASGNYGMAAYYANIAADTIIKGFMLRETGNELTGHSLATNCRQTSHFFKKLMTVFADCAQIDAYYFDEAAGQKPKDCTQAEAEKAINAAKKVAALE